MLEAKETFGIVESKFKRVFLKGIQTPEEALSHCKGITSTDGFPAIIEETKKNGLQIIASISYGIISKNPPIDTPEDNSKRSDLKKFNGTEYKIHQYGDITHDKIDKLIPKIQSYKSTQVLSAIIAETNLGSF